MMIKMTFVSKQIEVAIDMAVMTVITTNDGVQRGIPRKTVELARTEPVECKLYSY